MIPAVIPPLTGLSVLVTRPAPQSETLAARIRVLGGETWIQSAIDIKPLIADVPGTYELVIFVSVNAVAHGVQLIKRAEGMRVAAIGRATAAALAAAKLPADIVPERSATSEGLLEHPLLAVPGARVLIVRGAGGRDVLQQSFLAQGCVVDMLDVYERVLPALDEQRRNELELAWGSGGIDVVTATSVETLRNLQLLLSESGRARLQTTPLVVPSPRVAEAAALMGLTGECTVAAGADDEAIVGALSQWHARARLSSGHIRIS